MCRARPCSASSLIMAVGEMARRISLSGLRKEDLRTVECPDCGAPSGTVCARSEYSGNVRDRLEREGISHYRRMLKAYGVPESRWDYYVARNAAGASAESAPSAWEAAVEAVSCPLHSCDRGVPCDGPCPARMHKWAASATRHRARAERPKRPPAVGFRPGRPEAGILVPRNWPEGA